MKTNLFLLLILAVFAATTSCNKKQSSSPVKTKLTTEILKDKIKGGWAGQVIGCTFGGPTEFQYKGTLILLFFSDAERTTPTLLNVSKDGS